MQIKPTMRYHFIHTRMAVIKKRVNKKYRQRVEELEPSLWSGAATLLDGLVVSQTVIRGVAILSKRSKTCLHKDLYMNIHGNSIQNIPEVKITQMPINR